MTYEEVLRLATKRPWRRCPTEKAESPWILAQDDGTSIASFEPVGPWMLPAEADANVLLAGHAVNCHEELVAALEAMAHHFGPIEDNHMLNDEVRATFAKARAALERARTIEP